MIRRVSALTGQGGRRLLPAALELHAESKREIATHDVNTLLAEAVKRLPPPVGNRRRARLYYATQVSTGVSPTATTTSTQYKVRITPNRDRTLRNMSDHMPVNHKDGNNRSSSEYYHNSEELF